MIEALCCIGNDVVDCAGLLLFRGMREVYDSEVTRSRLFEGPSPQEPSCLPVLLNLSNDILDV